MDSPQFQPQFISHAQVVPPTLVPRRGLGLFSAVAFVLAVLGGAATGALVLYDKTLAQQDTAIKEDLAKLKKDFEIDSINRANEVQKRINLGKSLLDKHIYSSQAFNFVETTTLNDVHMTSFSYSGQKVKLGLLSPDFKTFAQQIRYYRSLKDKNIIDSMVSQPPRLADASARGEVSFNVEISLSSCYITKRCAKSDDAPQGPPSAADQAIPTIPTVNTNVGGTPTQPSQGDRN